MCGRYYIDDMPDSEELRRTIAEVSRRGADAPIKTSGEIRPGDTAPIVCRKRSGGIGAFPMRWGYGVGGRLVINARSETAEEKPLFRESMAARRCLIPASGYFEWALEGGKKRRYALSPEGGFCRMAGLYRFEGGTPVYTVLTREAAPDIAFIHDRMPLILDEGAGDMWLDPAARPRDVVSAALTRMLAEPR